VGFRDDCPGCGAALHVCRNCAHHAPDAYNGCREPTAERVLDPERANRCDQFAPAAGEGGSGDDARRRAREALDRLFRG
jgi:hypothetical protein